MKIEKALEILEIKNYEKISINLVKTKFRELQKKYHPDLNLGDSSEKLIDINNAYKFLIKFLENYEIEIDKLILQITPEEKFKKRFSDDWLSGKEI